MTLRKYKSSCNFQSVRFLRPNIWALVPQNIKNCISQQEFKRLIKVWKPLQNVQKVRSKYCFYLIQHKSLMRFIMDFHQYNLFWLVLIDTPIIQLGYCICKVMINKVFSLIQYNIKKILWQQVYYTTTVRRMAILVGDSKFYK